MKISVGVVVQLSDGHTFVRVIERTAADLALMSAKGMKVENVVEVAASEALQAVNEAAVKHFAGNE